MKEIVLRPRLLTFAAVSCLIATAFVIWQKDKFSYDNAIKLTFGFMTVNMLLLYFTKLVDYIIDKLFEYDTSIDREIRLNKTFESLIYFIKTAKTAGNKNLAFEVSDSMKDIENQLIEKINASGYVVEREECDRDKVNIKW